MIHKVMKFMLIGLLTGLSTSYIVLSLSVFFSDDQLISGERLLQQLIIAAVMGVVIGLATLIFEITRLSFVIQLILHYFSVVACVFCAGIVGQWFSFSDLRSIFNLIVIQLIAYTIIWLVVRVLIKKEVDEINELIQQRRKG